MFEQMDISESIYEGVVEPSYKNATLSDANHASNSRKKREEDASSKTQSAMGERDGKLRKQYSDFPSGESKTCLIHDPSHSSDEWKFLGYFGDKHSNGKPTKNRGNNPEPSKKTNKQQENNSIVNNVADEILLYETKRLITEREAP